MKRFVSLVLCAVLMFTCCVFQTSAVNEETYVPYIADVIITNPVYTNEAGDSRASGLIVSYKLYLSVSGTTLNIRAETYGNVDVVKSGFKNLVIQRKKVTDSSWSTYYDYGDLYTDTYATSMSTTRTVPSGYQYRLSCKHYAKKSLLVTQSVSNTSNVVAV